MVLKAAHDGREPTHDGRTVKIVTLLSYFTLKWSVLVERGPTKEQWRSSSRVEVHWCSRVQKADPDRKGSERIAVCFVCVGPQSQWAVRAAVLTHFTLIETAMGTWGLELEKCDGQGSAGKLWVLPSEGDVIWMRTAYVSTDWRPCTPCHDNSVPCDLFRQDNTKQWFDEHMSLRC